MLETESRTAWNAPRATRGTSKDLPGSPAEAGLLMEIVPASGHQLKLVAKGESAKAD